MRLPRFVASFLAVGAMLFAQGGNSASVEGQIVNAVTGEPVQGADLSFSGPAGVPLAPGSRPLQVRAQSGEQGRFAFSGLRAGRYQLMVQREGFVKKDAGSTQPTQVQFMLGEGQRLTGYVVRLAPESVISGTVLSAGGDPFAGIIVTASRWNYSTFSRNLVLCGSARTNELGEYRIAGLAAGSYVVVASAYDPATGRSVIRDEAGRVTAATYYGGATNPLSARAVAVAFAAETNGIDIKLASVSGVSIRGTVVGAGVAPQSIFMVVSQVTPGAARNSAEGIGVRPKPDGSFETRGVTPGSYNLIARQDAPRGGSVPPTLAQQAIEVGDKDLEGITLKLLPSSDVRGTLKLAAPEACALANRWITLTPSGGTGWGAIPRAAVGPDLAFTLRNVAPIAYAVDVSQGDRAKCYVQSVRYGGREAPQSAVPVTGDGTLEITLAAPGAVARVGAVDAHGQPLASGVAALLPDSGEAAVYSGLQRDGRTSFGSLRPGSYHLYAFEEPGLNAARNAEFLKSFENRAKAVTLAANAELEIDVTAIPAAETMDRALTSLPPIAESPRGSVSGTIVDGASAPIAGAAVTLRFGGWSGPLAPPLPAHAVTDAQGRFSFQDVEPGVYTLLPYGGEIVVGEGQRVEGVTRQAGQSHPSRP